MKKKTLLNVFRESTREAQKRNPRESSLVFEERDDCEKEDEKSYIVFTSSFQKFKRERRTSPKPRHHHHHRTQTRAVNKERERKNTHITEYLETG